MESEKKIEYKKPDGTSAKMEGLKLKTESIKKIINPNLLYIIYPLISLILAGLLIFMLYKMYFV